MEKSLNFSPFILKNVCSCSCECDKETYGKSIIEDFIKLDLSNNIKSFEEFEKETPINVRSIVTSPLDHIKVEMRFE